MRRGSIQIRLADDNREAFRHTAVKLGLGNRWEASLAFPALPDTKRAQRLLAAAARKLALRGTRNARRCVG